MTGEYEHTVFLCKRDASGFKSKRFSMEANHLFINLLSDKCVPLHLMHPFVLVQGPSALDVEGIRTVDFHICFSDH